jgi:hypothetical protein
MIRSVVILIAVAVIVLLIPLNLSAQTAMPCKPGASSEWNSGWCDFSKPVDFKKGELLRLAIGGSATRVLVRLLPKGSDPSTPVGVIPTPFVIPRNRYLEVVLPHDAADITQISVHGGENPWNQYHLGTGNGFATLTSIERMPIQSIPKK